MKQLSKLSPAETLLVLQDSDSSLKELLKVTFMDLLLKQVLRTFEVERQSNSREPVRIYKYVEIGKNFGIYQPLSHENIFLAPFQKNDSVQILFRHMVKMGYQNAKTESKLQRIIRQSPTIDKCFSRNILQSIFGGFNITEDGMEFRNKIKMEITQLEKQLPPLIINDQQKALDILKVIKGNIFILKNVEFDLLKQIEKELLAEMNKREGNYNGNGCSGCTWISFDHYSDNFDSSCSGDSGGGDGGCGGSGCSGCGGCGGD